MLKINKLSNQNKKQFSSGGSRGGARGARPPLILEKKEEEMTEGKMAAMASKSRPPPPPPPPPPIAQGLDPPLFSDPLYIQQGQRVAHRISANLGELFSYRRHQGLLYKKVGDARRKI